ncbi:MAG: BatA domain-containing protein [Leeuwenhoekiella sp.]
MQFLNPKILYALFLLVIPILVHLFQLRRFKKTAFTNVAFLKKIESSSRKSSKIKKWLVLVTRLLALTALILAFARPYFPQSENTAKPRETVVFIDNSFSMQAKGKSGTLLSEALQQLVTQFPERQEFSLVTHDNTFRNITVSETRNSLLDIGFSPKTLTLDEILLKAQTLFSNREETLKEFILVSDFQANYEALTSSDQVEQHWVKMQPLTLDNIGIDSISLMRKGTDYELLAQLSTTNTATASLPLSLFNGQQLVTKAAVNFKDAQTAEAVFTLPADVAIAGELRISDPNLLFDNSFYFSINAPQPLKVLSINAANDNFLSRLYRKPQFDYEKTSLAQLDYSRLLDKNVVVLNELPAIPVSLTEALLQFTASGGKLILIPNSEAESEAYQGLLSSYGFLPFGEKTSGTQRISQINYDHPLYEGVFTRRTDNLQFQTAQTTFRLEASDKIISYSSGRPFLAYSNNLYVFTAALNTSNSNFINSQLVVPTFDRMAIAALQLPETFYYLGSSNSFAVVTETAADVPLKLIKNAQAIIPLQVKKGSTIQVSGTEGLTEAGIYQMVYDQDTLGTVAFNYNRNEAKLTKTELSAPENVKTYESLKTAINTIEAGFKINTLSKWFVIFALVMLGLEMLLLKFVK